MQEGIFHLIDGADMGNSIKMESLLTEEQLPGIFRQLAEVFEKGAAESGLEALRGVEGFSKVGITVKREYGRLLLKVKIKCGEGECAAPAGDAPAEAVKYKDLKKRMKRSFKVVFASLEANVLPPDEAVEAFVRDSGLMVGFPGHGDEQYAAYSAAVETFGAAFAAGDLAATRAACAELDRIKSQCHNRFK